MYLSIGGNDLGFPLWIMAAIAGEGKLGAFLPVLKDSDAPECAARKRSCQQTRRRWDSLRARYDLLREVIDNRLAFEDRGVAPVLLYSYPLPIKGADKNICPPGNAGLTVFVMQRPPLRICLTDTQRGLPVLETIAEFAEQKLNGEVERLAGDKDRVGNLRPKWIVVKNYKIAFDNRSYCASTVRAASGGKAPEEPTPGCLSASEVRNLVRSFSVTGEAAQESLHLPLGGQTWQPFDPISDYRPYRHRSRLLRTMNETYFVINQLKAATQGIRASGILV